MDRMNSGFCTKNYETICRDGNEDAKYESCVCCHKPTNIAKNKDIEFRPFYIEGAGQLCYDCYHELYLQLKDNK